MNGVRRDFLCYFFFNNNDSCSVLMFKNLRDLGHSFFVAFLYQCFDVLGHFFRFDRRGVSAIWLSLVVNKNLLKVPCYVVVSYRRPANLLHVVDEVIRSWTSVL